MDLARTWIPRALAVAAFMLYAVAAPSGLYWLDSAELTAAALELGSPHPTGFPLYCLAGKLAALVPVGEIAYRLNLLSAASAALAVLWITRLTCELGRDDRPAIVGALCAGATLAVSLVFFRQATVVEVYAPNAALIAGGLLLLSRVARGGDARWGLALALVCGLGLAVHITFALLGPVVLALYVVRLYRGARWPLLAPLLVVLTAGALIGYLPLRSATGRTAAVDWGHPDDAGALISHVSAERYRHAYAGKIRSTVPEVVGHHAAQFAQGVADSVGPILLLFAPVGMIWLFGQRRDRWLAAALAMLLAGDAVFSVWIHPWGMAELQNTVPLCLALAVCAGAGVAWLARYLGAVGPYVGAVVGVMLVVPPALVSFPRVWAASSGDLPRVWAEAGLHRVPPRGLALVQNDSTASGLLYLTEVEHARPDVAVLVRQYLSDSERSRRLVARSQFGDGAGQAGQDDKDAGGRGMKWLLGLGRPLAWEIGRDAPPPGTALVAGVPLSRLERGPAERDAELARLGVNDATGNAHTGLRADLRADLRAAVARLGALFARPSHRDAAAAHVMADAFTSLGRLAYGRGDVDLAEQLFSMATGVLPDYAPAWVNRGVVAAARGQWRRAIEHTERALDADPNRTGALVNAARYHIQAGDDARARERLQRALRLDAARADAWALSALLDMRAGRPQPAMERIRRALAIDPRDPDALDLVRQLEAGRGKTGAPRPGP